MFLVGNLKIEDEEVVNAEESSYRPPKDVQEITERVREDYLTGLNIQNQKYREFDDNSVIEERNQAQKAFLNWTEPEPEDPDEKWKWRGIRPVTRNKIISMAAHVTSETLMPGVFAQNSQDEEDKQMAEVMQDMIEWNIRNSDYEIDFLYGVVAALVNPVAYWHVDFAEAMQTVKDIEDGQLVKKETVDEILSGLQVHNIPLDEILITNVHEYTLQKQKAVIRRKFTTIDDVRARYGDHENFKFVEPGVKVLMELSSGQFFEQMDESNPNLVEEVVYYNRREDLEIPFLNGVYMGDDNVEKNLITHRDTKGKPKYPFVKFGFEPVDEKRFFYYISLARKLNQDQQLANKMWRIAVDTSTLQSVPPTASTGPDELNTSIMIPGAHASFSEESKVQSLNTTNSTPALNILQLAQNSLERSSQDEIRQGVSQEGSQTAFEVARVEQNAKVQLGMFGKIIIDAVKKMGGLMIDNIVHHQTVGEVEDVLGGVPKLKFRNFLLPQKIEDGNEVTKEVRFTDELFGMDEEAKRRKSAQLLSEEGLEPDRKIMLVNPAKIKSMDFKVVMDAKRLMPRSEAFERAMNLQVYDRAIRDPNTDKQAITRDFLLGAFEKTKGNVDKYMADESPLPLQQILQGQGGQQPNPDNFAEQATREAALREV